MERNKYDIYFSLGDEAIQTAMEAIVSQLTFVSTDRLSSEEFKLRVPDAWAYVDMKTTTSRGYVPTTGDLLVGFIPPEDDNADVIMICDDRHPDRPLVTKSRYPDSPPLPIPGWIRDELTNDEVGRFVALTPGEAIFIFIHANHLCFYPPGRYMLAVAYCDSKTRYKVAVLPEIAGRLFTG